MAILINHLLFYCFCFFRPQTYEKFETTLLLLIVCCAVSAKSVMSKKMGKLEKQDDGNDSWSGNNYIGDWDHGEIKQIMIERKVPVFVEKIRHVPVVQKEYISVPRYITKPIYIERSYPIIVPRLQHYHHHHYSEYHHLH